MASDRLLSTAEAWITWRADAQEEVTGLWNGLPLPLSSIGGTANAITASVTPALTDGVVAGMSFFLKPTANNTGAVTLTISGDVSRNVLNTSGAALASGNLQSGWTYQIYFDGTSFILLGQSATPRITDYQVFTANGTWTKPTGTPNNAMVLVRIWAGGGGGALYAANSSVGGGGGGAFLERIFRASECGSTESVTVGAGGLGATNTSIPNNATAGGNSSFGSLAVAYGGGPGQRRAITSSPHDVDAGQGGSLFASGTQLIYSVTSLSGRELDSNYRGGDGVAVSTIFSGAGGAFGYFGSYSSGGVSLYGGNGGDANANGQVPGGGGGAGSSQGGNGARGEVQILTIG